MSAGPGTGRSLDQEVSFDALPRQRSAERADRDRLLAMHAVAARFYGSQLAGDDGAGPARFLKRRGVPVDGAWAVGYAPNRPRALINEFRRHRFTDRELRASGLVRTNEHGQMVDRFQDRVMIGIRDHHTSGAPVVGFVGYAAPGAGQDVRQRLQSPATAIYRPGEVLFGLAEQPDRTDGSSILAADPLEAITLSVTAEGDRAPPLVVAPSSSPLTSRHVAALAAAVDTEAGVTVTVGADDAGHRAAERAYRLLARATGRPDRLRAARAGGPVDDVRPLVQVVVTFIVNRAASMSKTVADRETAARSVVALLADHGADTSTLLTEYVARWLGVKLTLPGGAEPIANRSRSAASATREPREPPTRGRRAPGPDQHPLDFEELSEPPEGRERESAVADRADVESASVGPDPGVEGGPIGADPGRNEVASAAGGLADADAGVPDGTRGRVSGSARAGRSGVEVAAPEQPALVFDGEDGADVEGGSVGADPGRDEVFESQHADERLDSTDRQPLGAEQDPLAEDQPAAVEEAIGHALPDVEGGSVGADPGRDEVFESQHADERLDSTDRQPLGAEQDPLAEDQPAAVEEAIGHALPDDAEPVEGVDGYHYTRHEQQITVYGPDNAPVAIAQYVGGVMAGEVDGVRIPARAYGTSDFPQLAARQHRAANLPPDQRDRAWVELVPDNSAKAGYVVVVHGTIKDDPRDDRATKAAAHFQWSGQKKARVSVRTWKPATVDENFSRLLTEFARQGRDVVVVHAGVEREQAPTPAPAPTPALTRTAATPARPQPREELVSAPDPQSMTDAELLEAFRGADARTGHGIYRDDAAAARAATLSKERQDRVLRRVADALDVTGMSDDDLAVEEQWLKHAFARNAFVHRTDGDRLVAARREAVEGEARGRQARALMAGPALQELSDEALEETYDQTYQLWVRLRSAHPEHDAVQRHRDALREEMAVRRVRHYEQRTDVADLTSVELAAETAELATLKEHSALSPSEAVTAAREARLQAVDAEIDRREQARFPNELARAKVSGKEANRAVSIDGMPDTYGHVKTLPGPTFEAKVRYVHELGKFPSRPEAVAALVRHYDQDPETLPQRTWGAPRGIALPVGARTEIWDWLRSRSGADATPERQRLAELLAQIPTRQPDTNPFNGKTMHVYPYRIEEQLIGELARISERVTSDLRERSVNPDILKPDQETAKRRIPIMGAALHNLNRLLEWASAQGIDVDRRAVDVAAQLAALADDVETSDGGSDDEPVQHDGPTALGAVQAQRTRLDTRHGSVLHEEGQGVAGGDDRSAGGAGGDAATRDRLQDPSGSVESDPGDRGAAGDGGTASAAGGGRGPADAAESGPGRAGRDQARPEQPVTRFRPDPADLPRTPLERATANLEAIRVLRRLEQEGAGATHEDKCSLARWSGWGSVPMVFRERPDDRNPTYGQGGQREGRYEQDLARWEAYSPARDALRELLDPFEWNAAARAILSAHYTPQALADAMWDGLSAFGFDGGDVLEAGSGSGAFFGAAPDSDKVWLTGVELDPTSARISQLIYPHANVLIESFAETDAPVGVFDAAIGNVPFAQVPFAEPRYGAGGHSLHNGFLIKGLALVREGGLVMAVTSRWTLDAENEAARRQMARYGHLVAAYRLPAGVFAETAGTDVVVDALVFRRCAEGQAPAEPVWLHAPKREVNGSTHTINDYFAAHPEHVLGELTTRPGAFGPGVTVKGDPIQAMQQLRAALHRTAAVAKADGRAYEPNPLGLGRMPLHLATARDKHAHDYTGRLYIGEDGRIWQHLNGADPVEAIAADGNTERLLALIRMRDTATELKELDRTGDDRARAEEVRARLRQEHAAYTEAYGPLSRPRQTRLAGGTPTAWGWFREDPDAASVLALDSWDLRHQVAVPSEILTRRPGTRGGELHHTDDPQVALAAVLGTTGCVDLGRIADVLGVTPDDARRRLGTEVFDDPVTGRLEHAGAYLSGAVRGKLEEARAAATTNPAYAVNVAALEAVRPREKRIGQFTPQLGAHWIPPDVIQGFLRNYLGDPTLLVHHNDRYGWTVHAGKVPDAIDALKGTRRRPALHIARAVLGHGSLIVEDAVQRGEKIVRVVDEDASRAARQKADVMRSAFEEYVTADSARVKVVTKAYNRIMNGHVVRRYDDLAPTLAGFTDERTPHSHQLAGAARMQFERGVILAHEVGLGKTTTMIMGTQALKASGQVNKPFAVAQRHLTKQWLDEARFLYPNADIRLITSDMLSGDERRRTLEWLRSNTPDLTIFTEGAFTSVKMSPEYQEWYEFQELDTLREQILRERGVPDNTLAVRKLEQRVANLEVRLRRNAAPMRTPGELYWDDLGYDYAAIDELHRFKGVGFRSKQAGGETAKIRAVDLHQKLTQMHREAAAQGGKPTVTGATGTPLTNSISDLHP